MAKICSTCGSWCVYFLFFLNLNAVLTINEFQYTVENGVNSKDRFSIDLLDRNHQIEKRDIKPPTPPPPQQPILTHNGTATNTTKSVGDLDNNSSNMNKTLSEPKTTSTKNKLGKTTKTLPPPTTMPKLLNQDNLQKNATVNETSSRKILSPTSPSVNLLNNGNDQLISLNSTSDCDDIDDCLFTDDESDAFNKSLSNHNITITRYDHHLYYNSTVTSNHDIGNYWVDLTNKSDVKVNEHLSKSYRRAATVKLQFEFPFYGHLIKNVTIATGGFLYTGDYVHSWLAATQYIAPLMANFDTRISNNSHIRYWDSGSSFTVEWEKVVLQDQKEDGDFTFQTTLHSNGDIDFVYKNIPPFVKNIEDVHHPVKVGLSDAYIIDRTIFFVRRKTIYEYHRVHFPKEDLTNGTIILLKALPTCLVNEDCTSCTTNKIPGFQCQWCPTVGKCSNGLDRNRQDWLTHNCEKRQFNNETMCSHISSLEIFEDQNKTYQHDVRRFQELSNPYHDYSNAKIHEPVNMSVSSIMAILFLIAMVSGLAVWILYAYRNPHTTSGQILIRYRPSQWKWRRGEARYTAATIHM